MWNHYPCIKRVSIGSQHPGTELTVFGVKCCRSKLVPASRPAERQRADDVGDRSAVSPLRPDRCRPAELHRRPPGHLPAVPQAAAGRRPRPSGRPGAALPLGVRADDRRPGGAARRHTTPDGQDVGVGAVRDGAAGGCGAPRGTRFFTSVRHRRRSSSRSMAEVAANVCPGTCQSTAISVTKLAVLSVCMSLTDSKIYFQCGILTITLTLTLTLTLTVRIG